MKKLVLVILMILGIGTSVILAQTQVNTREIYGGGTFLGSGGVTLGGFTGSVAYGVRNNLKIVGEVSGTFGGLKCTITDVYYYGDVTEKISYRFYSFLGGPRYVFPIQREKFIPFAHVLVGIGRGGMKSSWDDQFLSTFDISIGTGLLLAFGGGVDYKWKDNFSLRLGQLDVLANSLGKFRYSGGIVYHF